jgi:hypothetical protein
MAILAVGRVRGRAHGIDDGRAHLPREDGGILMESL